MNTRTAYGFAIAFLGAFFLLFFIPNPAQAAFGISPPFLNANYLVPGSSYTETIYLVQDTPDQDLPIHANLQLDAPAQSWVSLDKGFDFVIPQGMRQFPVVITVSVPKDATLNIYRGTLTFNTVPSSAGQVTIALGAQVTVNLTVGNTVYEKYVVQGITFPDIYEGENPIADVKFENDGNVPESFDSATFEIFDQYDTVRLAYVEKNSGFPTTQPFSTNEYQIEFPTDFYMGVGQYWGIVTFYKNGQVVASQKTVFNVLKSDWFSKAIRYVQKEWAYLLVILVVILVLIFSLVRRLRKRKK